MVAVHAALVATLNRKSALSSFGPVAGKCKVTVSGLGIRLLRAICRIQ